MHKASLGSTHVTQTDQNHPTLGELEHFASCLFHPHLAKSQMEFGTKSLQSESGNLGDDVQL